MGTQYENLAGQLQAGGQLTLQASEVSARLGEPVDSSNYLKRVEVINRFNEVGIVAEFGSDGSLVLRKTAAPGQPAAHQTQLTAANVGEHMFWGLTVACTLSPAIAHQVFPAGEVGEKQDAFFAIYFATFPLSLAATFICLMLFGNWFSTDQERCFAAAVALIVSAVWGASFGVQFADTGAWHPQGNVFWVVIQYGALALFSYAKFYGLFMFVASWGASFFAALWLHEKAAEHGVDIVNENQ